VLRDGSRLRPVRFDRDLDRSGFITGTGSCRLLGESNITGRTGPEDQDRGSTWGIFSGTGAGSPINVNITLTGHGQCANDLVQGADLFPFDWPPRIQYFNNSGLVEK